MSKSFILIIFILLLWFYLEKNKEKTAIKTERKEGVIIENG